MSQTEQPPALQTTASVDALYQSYKFGRATLPNRVVMAPMTRSQSPDKVPTDTVVDYYRRRAAGGVGLIITEGVNPSVPRATGYPDVPDFDSEAASPMWKKVADAVHAEGGFIIPQIWHVGSVRQPGSGPEPNLPGHGPSPIVHPTYAKNDDAVAPDEMSQQDIDEAVAAFASVAREAERLGFDGAEIHGAHSYLVDQFFWEATNQRTDKYGGKTLAERTRFAVEIIEATRAAVSDDFPVVFRFSQWKQGDYKHKMAKTPEELEAFLMPLSDAGVDFFHASTRRFNDPEFEGSDLNLAGWTQKITGKPTMTVGSVGLDSDFLRSYAGKAAHKQGVDALIRRLEANEFDLVAVGRAFLSDAEWSNKVREGREDDIVEFEPKHMQVFP
jgi:2,4-dienoyl-CoA reductase-like NADH-dependent reductase (Old Yellow Enzyme family)